MHLNQFETTNEVRLNQILHTLKSVYDVHIKIDLDSPTAESMIMECKSSWESTRDRIISESSFNSYQQNPQYTKAMLILEAMRIMITEIAPRRRRRKMAESAKDTGLSIMRAQVNSKSKPGMDNVHEVDDDDDVNEEEDLKENDMVPADATEPSGETGGQQSGHVFSQAHHYEYQASMARSELYRNAKYAMSMMKQVDPDGEVQPWIAGALTKAANYLDKVFHYLDYYKTFEPDQLPEGMDGDMELGETSGGVTRQNLMLIMEYSNKLFNMIQPGDKLEGWVAMKLTTASECVSSCKHYMDYVQFENHALDDHFTNARRAKQTMNETAYERNLKDNEPLKVDYTEGMSDKIKTKKFPNMRAFEKWSDEKEGNISISRVYRALGESRFRSLMEQEDLAKAQAILAAKDITGKVQEMAEDVAKLSVEELMHLIDTIREQFGPEAATGYNSTVKSALDKLLDLTTSTKEELAKAADTLAQGGVPAGTTDIENAEIPGEEPPVGDDASASDELGSSEDDIEADLGQEEPLGRAKKDELAETIENGNNDLITVGDLVNITNPKATPRHKVIKIDGDRITVKKPDGTEATLPRERIMRSNPSLKESGFDDEMQKAVDDYLENGGTVTIGRGKPSFTNNGKKDEMQQAIDDYLANGGTITVGRTRKAKGIKPSKSGGHLGITGSSENTLGLALSRSRFKEAKKAKPDFLDVDDDGNKKEPFKKALADKKKGKKVDEDTKNCMECGVGMYEVDKRGKMRCNECGSVAVMEATGNVAPPGSPQASNTGAEVGDDVLAKIAKGGSVPGVKMTAADAERLQVERAKKKVTETAINKRAPKGENASRFIRKNTAIFKENHGNRWKKVLYATAWEKFGEKSESYVSAKKVMEQARARMAELSVMMEKHRRVFATMVNEGRNTDPLKMGYGLEGEAILDRMDRVEKKLNEAKSIMRHAMQEGVMGMLRNIQTLNKVDALKKLKATTPYGVIYETADGRRAKKMFESADARGFWIELHGRSVDNLRMVDPDTFDKAIKQLSKD